MATLYVRNIPDDLSRRIKVEAAKRGYRGQTEVVVEWLEAGSDALGLSPILAGDSGQPGRNGESD
jgi:hypothetical protein